MPDCQEGEGADSGPPHMIQYLTMGPESDGCEVTSGNAGGLGTRSLATAADRSSTPPQGCESLLQSTINSSPKQTGAQREVICPRVAHSARSHLLNSLGWQVKM